MVLKMRKRTGRDYAADADTLNIRTPIALFAATASVLMCVLGANTSHIQGLGALIVIPQIEPTVLIAVRNVDIQAQ